MKGAETESKRVNRQFATSVGVGGLPASQMVYWSLWGSLLYVASLVVSIPSGWFVALLVCPLGFLWTLTGSKQWKFYERFAKPMRYVYGKVSNSFVDGVPTKAQSVGQKKDFKQKQWEDRLDLITYVEFRYAGQSVGAHLSQGLDPTDYQVNFGFNSTGLHCAISEEDAEIAIKNEDAAFRTLPPNAKLKFIYSIWSKDGDRQRELAALADSKERQILERQLIESQRLRVRELSVQNARKIRTLKVYGSLKLSSNYNSRDRDLIGVILKFLESKWELFRGKRETNEFNRVHKILKIAYSEGYRKFHSLLNNTGYLSESMSAEQMWQQDYSLLHVQTPPPLPMVLVVDESGMRLERNPNVNSGYLHPTSLLSRPERGKQVYPQEDPNGGQFFYLPGKQLYGGFMQISPPDSYGLKPEGIDQLFYLWRLQSNPFISNCEFVTEFTLVDKNANRFSLERNTRFYKGVVKKADLAGTVDVNSEQRLQEAIAARRMMDEGQVPIKVGCGLFLYRKNPDALARDFEFVGNNLQCTDRAWFSCLEYLLESFPFTYRDFLTYKGDRREALASSQVAGMKGSILPVSLHRGGLEFISSQGQSPVYVNPFRELMHMCLIATTRGGKSVILQEIILTFFLMSMTVVGFDFPGPDGKSTFTDTIEILESLGHSCCYINILEHSSNPLEWPDLRRFNPQDPERKKREQFVFKNHLDALKILVLGASNQDEGLEKNVTAILSQALAHFHDLPEIQERYLAALDSQPGEIAWQNTPTLQTFLKIFDTWVKQYIKDNNETITDKEKEAIGLILSELRGTIKGPLGKAVAHPSSFNTGSQVTIFALTNVTSDAEAAVLVRIGYNALMNRSLEVQGSAFILDELAILMKFKSVAQIVGQICANGLKWGARVILSAQNIDAIVNSPAKADVLGNMSAFLIGYIRPNAKHNIASELHIPMEHLKQCDRESFRVDKRNIRSHWLLYHDNVLNFVDFYPSLLMLALAANNGDEREARDRYIQHYPDKVRAIAAFTEDYGQALKKGLPMSDLSPKSHERQKTAIK